MRVFVTGASGWVGAAVVKELLEAGHRVTGLARSEQGVAQVRAAGADAVFGTVGDLDLLARQAGDADGVIHTAFHHDFSNFAASCAEDRRAIDALGAALLGTTKPLLVTSGLAMLADGRLATEDDRPPANGRMPRVSEATADAWAARGVHASTVRLAPSTHGTGDHGFVPALIGMAREKGKAAYIGDGANRWAGVHRFDAARLYRLALEHGGIGRHWHAVADEGVAFRDIAAAIGRGLGVPVTALTADEAPAHFGWMAGFAGLDMAASSARTRAALGWAPRERGLLEDIERGGYF